MFRIGVAAALGCALSLGIGAAASAGERSGPTGAILFVDDAFIESKHGVSRTVHPLKQYPGNPIMVQDRPWECHREFRYYPSVCMWATPVIRDAKTGKFRMWYVGYHDKDEQGRDTGLLLYAESHDGIRWTKPDLGIVEWHGSKHNNIVLTGVSDGQSNVRSLDTTSLIYRPEERDPKDRYRLLTAMYTAPDVVEGVWAYRSADGLHWELVKADAVPNGREFNSFFWDERQAKYIGTVRVRRPVLPRKVGYTESLNCVDWTPAETIKTPADLNSRYNLPDDDVYGMCSFPYESHYISFLHTHHTDRRLEVQLMSSTDARHWDFVGEGEYVLPTDPRGGYGQGMMSTMSGAPIRVGDELWVYIGISPRAHSNPEFKSGPGQQARVIGLAKLRVDGFASLDAASEPGAVTTKPFRASGRTLLVNADATNGEVRAEVLSRDGKPLPGLSVADCIAAKGDGTKLQIRWKSARVPTEHVIRIRFELRNASIYSFRCE